MKSNDMQSELESLRSNIAVLLDMVKKLEIEEIRYLNKTLASEISSLKELKELNKRADEIFGVSEEEK